MVLVSFRSGEWSFLLPRRAVLRRAGLLSAGLTAPASLWGQDLACCRAPGRVEPTADTGGGQAGRWAAGPVRAGAVGAGAEVGATSVHGSC